MTTTTLVALLVFASVFAVASALIKVIAAGGERRLRARLAAVRDETDDGEKPALLIREKYLRRLSLPERVLEELPGMAAIGRLVEQSGRTTPAYRVALASLACGMLACIVIGLVRGPTFALIAALAATPLPVLRLVLARRERMRQFEDQLPNALDMMARALRAGTPFVEAFKFVAEEMHGPIADEFRTTWSHINFGIGVKAALADLVERMPCVSLRALSTAVLVQRETGGNLAEVLDKISHVLRARFRFQRRLHTLTAEGRISAWVLIAMPFALAAMLSMVAPTYLPLLTQDAFGRKLIFGAIGLMVLGVFWIRSVIRVRV